MFKVEAIARILCEDRGYDSDELEPGDLPNIDGYCPNGDPGHYIWKEFIPLASKIIRRLGETNET